MNGLNLHGATQPLCSCGCACLMAVAPTPADDIHLLSNRIHQHSPRKEGMFLKRRQTNSEASGSNSNPNPSRCGWI